MFNEVVMKEILRTMMTGWMIRENSWDDENSAYHVSEPEAMKQACHGDEKMARALSLFSYWSNDIQDVAAHYGIAFVDSEVKDIEPAPSPMHYWHKGKWNAPDEDEQETGYRAYGKLKRQRRIRVTK